MSHAPERTEKDCLNCGTTVHGRYCHFCGQENVVTHESFGKLVLHFFYDITHFDSKFFDTLRYLLFRPGYLSKEYLRGRRARYLNPIRMYVFTSAIFFLIFFSLIGPTDTFKLSDDEPFSLAERDSALAVDRKLLLEHPNDPLAKKRIELLSDTTNNLRPSNLFAYSDDFTAVGTINRNYSSRREYDSIQNSLSSNEKDGWLIGLWNKRAIAVNEKYKYDPALSMEKIGDSILHKLPYLLFVSLPFFALILTALYFRRKNLYYADHGIFSVHHYILSFILLLFTFLWDEMHEVTGWNVWAWLKGLTTVALPAYLYIAMKRFYGQGYLKTFVKFLLLNIAGLIMIILLLSIFFLFSIFQI